MTESSPVDADRRTAVLQSALLTFARFGYRKTHMDQVARDADISRPGLYFLFASKQALFREAVERCLQDDLAEIERILSNSEHTLQDRLLRAFDTWAGRYLGPLTRDIPTVVDSNPDLLGPTARTASTTFSVLVTDAVAGHRDRVDAERIASTLISTSIGIKHQVDERELYLARLTVAIDLLLASSSPSD